MTATYSHIIMFMQSQVCGWQYSASTFPELMQDGANGKTPNLTNKSDISYLKPARPLMSVG